MGRTLKKRWKAAERRAKALEAETGYLKSSRARYARALRQAGGELQTLRAVLAALAGENEIRVEREKILKADGGRLRCSLSEGGEALRVWVEREKAGSGA